MPNTQWPDAARRRQRPASHLLEQTVNFEFAFVGHRFGGGRAVLDELDGIIEGLRSTCNSIMSKQLRECLLPVSVAAARMELTSREAAAMVGFSWCEVTSV